MAAQDDNARFTFFFPEARILSEQEIGALPSEKVQAAAQSGKKGVWLEINCPDRSCISAEGKITLSPAGTETTKKEGVWLNLFCPQDSCELQQNTDLP